MSGNDADDANLESQLRNLILSNVRITPESTPSTTQEPGVHRGQHTPRGSYHRRPNEYHSRSRDHNDTQQQRAMPPPLSKQSHQSYRGARNSYNGPIPDQRSPVSPALSPLNQSHASLSPLGVDSFGSHARHSSLPHPGPRFGQTGQHSKPTQISPTASNGHSRPTPRSRQLYQANAKPPPSPAIFIAQCEYLDRIASSEVAIVQMSFEEFTQKDEFRKMLERGFQQTLINNDYPGSEILSLRSFGSFSSGFATKGSDVDLAIVIKPNSLLPDRMSQLQHDLPRILEKTLLDANFGARLLTRTRVPIIKVCESPTPELFAALREERDKWDALPDDEKYPSSTKEQELNQDDTDWKWKNSKENPPPTSEEDNNKTSAVQPDTLTAEGPPSGAANAHKSSQPVYANTTGNATDLPLSSPSADTQTKSPAKPRPWLREKVAGPLDFPKAGVGIQVDINFTNPLALHNTQLLRCYSLCDPRVQPMVLFVKAWAKRRKINSSYSGTLSSYGWVLMVLHFLINVVKPPVLPNLQLFRASNAQSPWNAGLQWLPVPDQGIVIDGYDVRFWRDEEQIRQLAQQQKLTQNAEPLGVLLRNFFHYYAQQGQTVIGRGFNWTQEVLSLRTVGGIISKQEKGWTGAKTTVLENVSRPPTSRFAVLLSHADKIRREKFGTDICLPSRIPLSWNTTSPERLHTMAS